MASLQETKRRIKAVTNTNQITRAMEMVSATKMRRSQEIALRTRAYAIEALRILSEMSRRTTYRPALMKRRTVRRTAVLIVTSDRGLAGSFNSNIFRVFEEKVSPFISDRAKYVFFAVGKKAEEYFRRKQIIPERAFKDVGDYIEPQETRPLSDLLIEGFIKKKWDKVMVISTHFRTTLRQDVIVRDLLPITARKITETIRELVPEYGRFSELREEDAPRTWAETFEYLVEPSPERVLDELAPKLFAVAVYDLILEANASEHSARMVAMKNASENAAELKNELTLEYNKSRQASITREISEIVGSAEALKT